MTYGGYRKRDIAREGGKAFGWGVVGMAVLVVFALIVASMWLFGFGLWSQKTAGFRGETQKRNLVEGSGQFRIQAYDHFYDACASIVGIEAQLAAQEDLRRRATTADARERIDTNIAALAGTRRDAIAHYNADARKSYTSGQFRSSDLPYQIDPSAKETTCTA